MEDQEVGWFSIDNLPMNIISNVQWLTYFAKNWWKQGNTDNLSFGEFTYYNI